MNEVSNESGCGPLPDSDEGKKDKGDDKNRISLCCAERVKWEQEVQQNLIKNKKKCKKSEVHLTKVWKWGHEQLVRMNTNIPNIALWVRGFSEPKSLMILLGELFPQQILIRNDIYVKIKILRKQSFNCHCIVTTHYH